MDPRVEFLPARTARTRPYTAGKDQRRLRTWMNQTSRATKSCRSDHRCGRRRVAVAITAPPRARSSDRGRWIAQPDHGPGGRICRIACFAAGQKPSKPPGFRSRRCRRRTWRSSRRFTRRFEGGDRDEWREYFDPKVVFDTSATEMPFAGVYHGHKGIERFFRDWLGTWKDYEIAHREYIDAGDAVVVVFRQSGTGRGSGVRTERDFLRLRTAGIEGRAVPHVRVAPGSPRSRGAFGVGDVAGERGGRSGCENWVLARFRYVTVGEDSASPLRRPWALSSSSASERSGGRISAGRWPRPSEPPGWAHSETTGSEAPRLAENVGSTRGFIRGPAEPD